jgi:hypothetical protein
VYGSISQLACNKIHSMKEIQLLVKYWLTMFRMAQSTNALCVSP